uniref:DekiORF137 n=1 Tax=Dendrolimus kikuchii nucleopolyhedrovirus TaxID=1219875 RepID=V9LSX0_9ABAC|nr:DekiORF137 [Dendrolimus kikuchii nucleopolyhedrovirus]
MCSDYNFNYRYIVDNNNIKYFNVIDFCRGLKIKHDSCSVNDWDQVRHINEILFNRRTDRNVNLSGGHFATNQGLIGILQKQNFHDKRAVLSTIKTAAIRERLSELDATQCAFEKRFVCLESKLHTMECAQSKYKQQQQDRFESIECALQQLQKRTVVPVTFPRDTAKHQHLAVFSEALDDCNTRLAFVSGQMQHFRKRKMQYEDDMETVFDGVHPNPVLAIQCISEKFYDKNYKVRKLARRLIDVNCNASVAKEVIHEVL